MTTIDLPTIEPVVVSSIFDVASLYEQAERARVQAYAPYSGFAVGAALLTADDTVITAGNVENGSYGLTICAERAAVVRAVAEGHRRFRALAIAVVAERTAMAPPCGACLQVLAEFDAEGELIVAFPRGNTLQIARLSDLLPIRFHLGPERKASVPGGSVDPASA